MSILSDNEIKSRCIRPIFVASRKTEQNDTEYAMFHSVTKDEVEKQIFLFNRSLFGVGNIDELLLQYPDDQKPTVIETFADKFYTVREIPEDEDISDKWKPMIYPFVENSVREDNEKKIISYGLSSYGYDVRLQNKFKIFTNINSAIIDPLNFDETTHVDHEGEYCIIPPNSYILGVTVEKFNIPRDVMVVCVGKSTYARCGAIINVTPIEPEFNSYIVIEISNSTNLPLKVYANQGIAQFLFFQGNQPCEVSYLDRNGKYLNQEGIQTAIV